MKKGEVLFASTRRPTGCKSRNPGAGSRSRRRASGNRASLAGPAPATASTLSATNRVGEVPGETRNARWGSTRPPYIRRRRHADQRAVAARVRWLCRFPVAPAMTFVENEHQNHCGCFTRTSCTRSRPATKPNALKTLPEKVLKDQGQLDRVAQGQGQLTVSGVLPQTGPHAGPGPLCRSSSTSEEKDLATFLAAGAVGDAAIYTQHLEATHIIRKVVCGLGSYLKLPHTETALRRRMRRIVLLARSSPRLPLVPEAAARPGRNARAGPSRT